MDLNHCSLDLLAVTLLVWREAEGERMTVERGSRRGYCIAENRGFRVDGEGW
jgi:hypothetical protein